MPDFLSRMAAASRARAADARSRLGEGQLVRRASLRPVPPPLRLDPRFDVFAEIKPASPGAGRLAAIGPGGGDALIERARRYARAGAAAVSVLTEPSAFGGSLLLLEGLALATTIPVLRKDFLVDPYQIAEARDRGAAGVLLIVRLLPGAALDEMLEAVSRFSLFALLEVFDEAELDRALEAAAAASGPVLVGINARDLETLVVDTGRWERLAPRAAPHAIVVAESGVTSPSDAARAAYAGCRAVLAGEALMRDPDPSARLAAMIGAGRGTIGAREARG